MNDFKRVKEEYGKKYQGFGSYTECMTRSLFTGVASFALSFSALYFTQVLLKSHLPYGRQSYLVLPAIVSSGIAWKVTSDRSRICQDVWTRSEAEYTKMES